MEIQKFALQEEIQRWINFHMNHMRELQEWSVNLDRNYNNIELSMREYGNVLLDELQIMGYKVNSKIDINTVDKKDLPPEPIQNAGPSVSTASNTSSHKENVVAENSATTDTQQIGSRKITTIEIAHPIQPKDNGSKTTFKLE